MSYISKFTVSCLALYEEANLMGKKDICVHVRACVFKISSVYECFF